MFRNVNYLHQVVNHITGVDLIEEAGKTTTPGLVHLLMWSTGGVQAGAQPS